MTMTLQQIARFVPVHILPPQFYAAPAKPEDTAEMQYHMDLSEKPVTARCEDWGTFAIVPGSLHSKTVMSRSVVWNQGKKTSPGIVGIDPVSKRVLTTTGDVYELGKPLGIYAKGNPIHLAELGFGKEGK